VREGNSRAVKDEMSRDILKGFDEANLSIASTAYEITSLPPVKVELSSIQNASH
jgi:hypothetical protein